MSSWNEMKLDEAVIINPKITLQKGCLYKYVAMSNLLPFTKKINNYILKEYTGGGAKFANGDTLFARITPCLENGKTAFVDFLDEKEYGFGSTEFIVIRGRKGITENHFVYYLFLSPKIRTKAIQLMSGSSGRQRVQVDAFKLIKIKIPPLVEQKNIITILSMIDQKIELNQKMNKVLEEMAQDIFKSWFIDFEPFKDGEFEYNEELDKEIPKGWQVKSINDIAYYINGKAFTKLSTPTGKMIIKIAELKNGIGSTTKYYDGPVSSENTAYFDDILFAWSASLGVYRWFGETSVINQHIFKVIPNGFPKWFVYYQLLFAMPWFIKIAESKTTTMGHIKRSHLEEYKIVLPPYEIIQRLNSIIEPIYNKIAFNSKEMNILKKIRDILLPQLISGRLRITNSEKLLEEIDNENN